jgi:ribosomal protein L22
MAVRGGGGRCVVNSRGRELFYSSIKKTNSKSSLGPSSSSSSFLSTSSSSSTTTETSSSASSSSSSLPLSSSSSSPSYSISEVDPSTIRTRGAVSVESHLRGKRGFLSFPGGLSPLLRRVNASLRSVKGHTKKLSPVARLVTGMGVSEALAQLAFSASSRASAVTKVIERAIIKADLDHGLKRGDLVVEAAWTGKHVSYPRLRHHAKGRGGKSFKRTSQVSVSLREKVDEEKKKTTKKIIMKSGEEVLNTTTLMGGGDGGVKLQVDVRGY